MKSWNISLPASSLQLPSLVFDQKCSLELTMKLSLNFCPTSSFILLVQSPTESSRLLTTSKNWTQTLVGGGEWFFYTLNTCVFFFFLPHGPKIVQSSCTQSITHGLLRLREALPGGKRVEWGEKLLTSSIFSYLPLLPMTLSPEAKTKVTNRSGIEKVFQTVVGSLLSREGIKGRRGTTQRMELRVVRISLQ